MWEAEDTWSAKLGDTDCSGLWKRQVFKSNYWSCKADRGWYRQKRKGLLAQAVLTRKNRKQTNSRTTYVLKRAKWEFSSKRLD